ncbi:unnamed protein product [Pylaiella littoralis]
MQGRRYLAICCDGKPPNVHTSNVSLSERAKKKGTRRNRSQDKEGCRRWGPDRTSRRKKRF